MREFRRILKNPQVRKIQTMIESSQARENNLLCGAREYSMISTIAKPLSASNVLHMVDRPAFERVSLLKRPLDWVVDKLRPHRVRCCGVF